MSELPRPILAQVLAADRIGRTASTPGVRVVEVVEAPGSTPVDPALMIPIEELSRDYAPDADVSDGAEPVLKQVRLPGGVMMLAQFSDAGTDRRGRPGHIVHGLLHSAPLTDGARGLRRPSELFASPMWVRPVGVDEVGATTIQGTWFALPPGPLRFEDLVGDAFLTDLDHPERIAALPVVLEAFRSALAGEAVLVLIVASTTEAAKWIALMSGLIDPASASRLRFSTREDITGPSQLRASDFDVVGVLPSAAWEGPDPAVLRDRLLIIDTGRPPVERADSTWALLGATIKRSSWTELAETVLMSPVGAAAAVAELDLLAGHLEGVESAPSWGLAAAAVLAGVELPDVASALRHITSAWPGEPPEESSVVDRLVAAVAEALGTQAEAIVTVASQLATGVPAPLADKIVALAAVRVLERLGEDSEPPDFHRMLPSHVAEAIAGELPRLLAWLPGLAVVDRIAAITQIVRFCAAVGVPEPAVYSALESSVSDLAAAIVNPSTDPGAEGWAMLSAGFWSAVVVHAVDALLEERGADREVSPATHQWLAPVLRPQDLPEHAVQNEVLALSAYGKRRAAWQGADQEDSWSSAVYAIGLMHVFEFRHGLSLVEAVEEAVDQAFAEYTIPVDVAQAMLDLLGPENFEARVVIAWMAFADGEYRRDQQALAETFRTDMQRHPSPMDEDVAPIYLQLLWGRLTRGVPSRAIEPSVVRAAAYVVTSRPELESAGLRDEARSLILQWGLRLPVHAICGVSGPPADDTAAAVLRTVAPDLDGFGEAVHTMLAQGDPAKVDILACLLARGGLALLHGGEASVYDPYARFLGQRDDRGDAVFLKGSVAGWLGQAGWPALAELDRAWDRVIQDLAERGWLPRIREFYADKERVLDALVHGGQLDGRLRHRQTRWTSR